MSNLPVQLISQTWSPWNHFFFAVSLIPYNQCIRKFFGSIWKYVLNPLAFLHSTVSAITPSPIIFYPDYSNYFLNNSHLLYFLPQYTHNMFLSQKLEWADKLQIKLFYFIQTLPRLYIVFKIISKSFAMTLHDLIFVYVSDHWENALSCTILVFFLYLETDKIVSNLGPLCWVISLGCSSLKFSLSCLLMIRY